MAFGLLGFLPDMVAASRPDSPVGLAVQAISCAFSTTRTSDPQARTRRAITYGKALTSTNAALRDQSLQTRDDTVTSVWLLSLYELIVGSSPPQMHVGPATWNLHTQGMATLLQLRGTAGFDSVVGRNLFWLLFNSVQIRCMVTGQSCPPESINWLQELEKHLEGKDMPSIQMSLYGCHASALCEKIRNFVDNESSDSLAVAFEILEEAGALHADTTYDALIPRPTTYEIRLLSDPVVTSQHNFKTPFVRTFFCGFRLKFLLCVSELLAKIQDLSSDLTGSQLPSQMQHNIIDIQNVADEILALAPHIFRSEGVEERTKTGRPRFWMDGLRLLWPLRLVAFWPATRPDQKESAAAILRSIREELGVVQATQVFVTGPGRSYPPTRMSPTAMRR
ncbi:hypothetical protein LTR99_006765 [Exophiala xenobiotica]|uniref:C6 zinc finger domain protein n=1 Tax=Vermiconidia calcicola TaxID=1690605 RepID=A0AAV9Q073_9PEZI|nr:hypothetical protein LTR92_006584 [Exophiala xenobiotica]KAK5531761.1 hypothetical protein LTR25_008091 [Vermiconidia calcicola]KAK5542770.1 hypothetical protein LTR23_005380 [Chaetothyriales sp. CCFEE 6169]KAK5204753.1 hypothetical protein LTR41_009609 [Exophiala xenobiotica]KAK5232646.1 hypothetical protein LTR47_006210 [Exophiala xenobiotica]